MVAAHLAQTDLVDHPVADVLFAIAAGFAMAAVSRLLVPRVRSISWPTSALLSAVGGSAALAAASLTGRDPTLLAVVGALAFTILLLLAATLVESRIRPAVGVHATETAEILRLGESGVVEFKSTARRNLHSMERDPKLEAVIAKTVCGFLNGRGGTLLIGVDDDGVPLGLGADLDLMKRPDNDSYQLFLRDLFTLTLGVPAASGVRVRFESVADTDAGEVDLDNETDAVEICRVDVAPSPSPVFLVPPKEKGKGQGDPEFWVRSGNGTRRLRIDELLDYHHRRWGAWSSRLFHS